MEQLISMFLGGADWITVMAFFVIGVCYLLLPTLGYIVGGRKPFHAAMMVLLGLLALGVLQSLLVLVMSEDIMRRGAGFFAVFGLLKGIALLAALFLFSRDLFSLERKSL